MDEETQKMMSAFSNLLPEGFVVVEEKYLMDIETALSHWKQEFKLHNRGAKKWDWEKRNEG